MNKTKQVSALLIAALVATGVTGSVQAQEGNAREDRRAEMFAELDANNDGTISAEEFQAGGDRFARSDANGDGLLTAEEMAAIGGERAMRRAERMIERLDENGDGSLSREEVESRRDPSRLFARLDTNDDGQISEEEFADAREMMRRDGGKRHKR